MPLFLKENIEEEPSEVFTEEEVDTIFGNFISYAERKLKGYSTKEIDILANRAKKMSTEEVKRDLLSRIDAAKKDANTALQKAEAGTDKYRELRLQIQVLGELNSKVKAFKITKHDQPEKKDDRDVIDLDHN
jgi:hypothetical protein